MCVSVYWSYSLVTKVAGEVVGAEERSKLSLKYLVSYQYLGDRQLSETNEPSRIDRNAVQALQRLRKD
jgi:hypothetical protein